MAFLHGKATEDVEADPAEHHARIRLPVNEAFDDVNDEAAERAEVLFGRIPTPAGVAGWLESMLVDSFEVCVCCGHRPALVSEGAGKYPASTSAQAVDDEPRLSPPAGLQNRRDRPAPVERTHNRGNLAPSR